MRKRLPTALLFPVGLAMLIAWRVGFADEPAPPSVRAHEGRTYEYSGKMCRRLFIANQYGAYVLGLRQGDSPPSTDIGLPQAPHQHNFLPWGFFGVEVNGIPQNVLEPKAVAEWRDGDRAGWTMRFNFDGVFLDLRFFLFPDSPLLWCEAVLEPMEGVSVESAKVTVRCYPGLMIAHHFLSEIYGRVVFTPERELPLMQEKKWPKPVPLTRADRLLVFNDRKHLPPEGYGPCAVVLDWNGLAGAEVVAGKCTYQARTVLNIDPNRRTFRLAVFSSKKRFGEAELIKYLSPHLSP